MRLSHLAFAVFLIAAAPALAQETQPGDACANAGRIQETGGPEQSPGRILICDGATWKALNERTTDGKSLFQVGSDTGSCTDDKQGRLRYTSVTDFWEYCDGSAWSPFERSVFCGFSDGACPSSNDSYMGCISGETFEWGAVSCTDQGAYHLMEFSTPKVGAYRIGGSDASAAREAGALFCHELGLGFSNTTTTATVNASTAKAWGTPPVSGDLWNLFATVENNSKVNNLVCTDKDTGLPDPCAGSPAAGTRCVDGSVYAGLSPDGNVKMYATREDAPAIRSWNNGNTSGRTATGASSNTDGDGNTTTIIAADADTGTGGTQPHKAAQYCADLSAHGHSDWYLPAGGEISVLYTNRAAIGNFQPLQYWSSTENFFGPADSADAYDFTNGSAAGNFKSNFLPLRCVRK